MHTAATNTLVDLFLDLPRQDWTRPTARLARRAALVEAKRDQERQAKRRKDTKPSRDLAALRGGLRGAGLRTGRGVAGSGRDSALQWSSFRKELVHFHFDTFTVKADDNLDGEEVLFGSTAPARSFLAVPGDGVPQGRG